MKIHKTIHKPGLAEIIEMKSRFIGAVSRVENETDCAALIEAARKQHYNAAHNVFAFQLLGKDGRIDLQRSSDDGEPSGTAGFPVLNVLTGEGIFDALIIVTRYFGGTLLGTGGLVRAYTAAAKAALGAAVVIEKIPHNTFEITIPYHLHGKFKHAFEMQGYHINDTQYAENITLSVFCLPEAEHDVVSLTNNLSAGTAEIKKQPDVYKTRYI